MPTRHSVTHTRELPEFDERAGEHGDRMTESLADDEEDVRSNYLLDRNGVASLALRDGVKAMSVGTGCSV